MKKVLFSTLFLGLVFFACEKNELSVEPTFESSLDDNEIIQTRAANNLRVFYDNGAQPGVDGVDFGCKDSGGNCLPTVVVHGIANQEVIGFLVDVISDNNPDVISEVFSTHTDVLMEYISSELIEGVIQGSYEVRARGNFTDESSVYLQFNDQDGQRAIISQLSK